MVTVACQASTTTAVRRIRVGGPKRSPGWWTKTGGWRMLWSYDPHYRSPPAAPAVLDCYVPISRLADRLPTAGADHDCAAIVSIADQERREGVLSTQRRGSTSWVRGRSL